MGLRTVGPPFELFTGHGCIWDNAVREVAIMPDAVGQFTKAKYFSLETFRKTGIGVRTPVWFAQDPTSGSVARFYIYTLPETGKVKRIRNNSKVRIAPCNMRGELRGAWVDARARICDSAEGEKGQDLVRQKYGWMKKVGDFLSGLRGRTQLVVAIEID